MKRENGRHIITIGMAGNPNCGKTTLFNALTGAKLKTANWPGVTVERVEGEAECAQGRVKIVDLPGIYSLDSYSLEERISRDWIMGKEADVIINVADASNLERNLYLTLRLLDLKKPVILALNMMDLVRKKGIHIDMERLEEILGIPVVPVSARTGEGLSRLLMKAVETAEKDSYGKRAGERKNTSDNNYNYIKQIVGECVRAKKEKKALTEKADKILLHPIWGIPAFFLVLALVFFLTFTVGDFLKGYFEEGLEIFLESIRQLLAQTGTADWMISLITDGILAGVGGIVMFLPNLFFLFLLLALLEDSGYMARAAYVMDDFMGKAGLSGKSFLPMILGFGCTVPAVMASRTLENERVKRQTMLAIPFMSCSARLPIYILFGGAFFGKWAMAVSYSMYVTGFLAAVFVVWCYGRLSKRTNETFLLIELPEYHMPSPRTVGIYIKEKIRDYLTKAGTTIFLASVLLWLVLNLGPSGWAAEVSESFGAAIGQYLVPLLRPAGFGFWQMGVALLSGLTAKEVVVSSCSVLFGIGNISSPSGTAAFAKALGNMGFGPLNAYAFMIFCLLYTPCMAAIGAIHKESGSTKWTVFILAVQLFFAWAVSAAVFQTGRLFLL